MRHTTDESKFLGVLLIFLGLVLFVIATADLWWRLLLISISFLCMKRGFSYILGARSWWTFFINNRDRRFFDE